MAGNILDVIRKNQENIKSSLTELIELVKSQGRYEGKIEYPLTLTVPEVAEILRINV